MNQTDATEEVQSAVSKVTFCLRRFHAVHHSQEESSRWTMPPHCFYIILHQSATNKGMLNTQDCVCVCHNH